MQATTVKIKENTKKGLDEFRESVSESYDDVIRKVIFIAKNAKDKPELSAETLHAIDRARKRIKEGHFLTESEARKRLGL